MNKLNRSLLLVLASYCLVASVSAQKLSKPEGTTAESAGVASMEAAVATISEKECYDHVQVLASPEMSGRGTMSAGFDLAAEYVEAHLESLGYQPAAGESYRVPISLNCIVAGENCGFMISGLKKKEDAPPLVVEQDFVPVLGSQELMAKGEPVFIGYAIDSKKDKWVDIKGKSIKGKIVFAFTREPRADDPKAKTFDGPQPTRHSMVRQKAQEVADAGGLGLVLVPDPGILAADHRPMPGMVPYVDDSGRALNAFKGRRFGFASIPVMSVSREVAGEVFGTDITDYYHSMNKKKKPKLLKAKKGIEVLLEVEWDKATRETYNLAALLPGTSGNGEVLVLGSHLDHVGFDVMMDGMSMVVRPGADDNASGSAAMMEVAEALAGTRPEIDILLLWFTGEELGLLGSREYCEDPLIPLEKTVAMFNMDMVGRGETKKINIGGLWELPQWEDMIKDVHKRIKSKLKMDN
ncbi:MAG: M28 family peptidase, partial [Planctomycetes bacterium]|nr:M28 family peptidase [Planctomycetota bacterium]